jgi:MFS family permease
VFSSLIGATTAVWQVGVLRAAAWTARGLRVPARNALLADVVPRAAYGRAYGFERMMDNLGAIGGPLLALALVAAVGTRTAMLVSVVPGLLAAGAILYAIHVTRRATYQEERRPIRIRLRPVLRGDLGRILAGVTAFEVGNIAATLLILRAVDLLQPAHGTDRAAEIALVLYMLYNAAAAVVSVPGGRLGDRRTPLQVLVLGVVFFGIAYTGLAFTGPSIALLAAFFAAAGVAIGLVETAEHAAVATHAPRELRGSAFGALAGIQSLGNFAASAVAGLLWTVVSPRAAFLYLVAWMLAAALTLAAAGRPERS